MKWIVGLAFLAVPGLLPAQTPADSLRTADDSAHEAQVDSLGPVLDHTFTGQGEYARFFMSGGTVYRAIVDRNEVQLVVEGVLPSLPPVTVIQLQRFQDATGQTEFLIRAVVDGDYQLRVPFSAPPDTTINGGIISPMISSSRVRLYRDEKETERWNATRTVAWAVGLEVSGGASQAYPVMGSGPVTGTTGNIEACLEARYGPGFGAYVSGCILGVRHESPHGSPGATYVFIEPRVRLIGRGRRWSQALDAGLLLRAGLGEIDRQNLQPGLVAPGFYLDFTVLHHAHLPSIVLESSARYAYIFSAGTGTQNSLQGSFGIAIF